MLTLHVSCFIKVDDNKNRINWNKILVSDIMALERAAEIWPGMTKLSWVVNKELLAVCVCVCVCVDGMGGGGGGEWIR